MKVADIIHGALRRFTDGLGQLWCSLADYYIRGSHFEKARDVYEEAIQTVMTVRDFGEVCLIIVCARFFISIMLTSVWKNKHMERLLLYCLTI